MKSDTLRLFLIPALVLASTQPCLQAAQLPDKRLKDKDPVVRQDAVEQLTKDGGEKAAAWLLKALDDDDWGVMRAVIVGLGQHGDRTAMKPLLDLCLEGPLRSLREAAAQSLAKLDGPEAAKSLSKKLSSKSKGEVVRAMALLARFGALPEDVEGLEKLFQHKKEEELRPLAALAWLSCAAPAEKPAIFEALMGSERLLVQCGAAEALAATPSPECIPALVRMMAEGNHNPVVARRLVRALVACLGAVPAGEEREATLRAAIDAPLGKQAPGGAYRARFVEWGLQGDAPVLTPELALAEIQALGTSADATVRAMAYRALASVRLPATMDYLAEQLAAERSPSGVTVLAQTWQALSGWEHEAATKALVAAVANQEDAATLEALAVVLARPELAGGEDALSHVSKNGGPEGLACALVAIGKARGPQALAALSAQQAHPDWRIRGAVATGLMHLATDESFEALMKMTEDANASVALTANWGLQRLAGREGQGMPPNGWADWWSHHKDKDSLRQRELQLRSHEKYGYQVPDSLIYSGLDVVVVPGRGDHIEAVLDRLHIQYRKVEAGQLESAGLHPMAILIVGCTGEIANSDVPVVQWYVRMGGALFTSCWSLTYTTSRAFPGHLRTFRTGHEVLDRVQTTPASANSTFLNGVFAGGSVPIYSLEGAHLIEVMDPLRAEVLIDSPEAAERHGSGEMAAWFRVGHGTVLDSVNHFELQGLESATELKKPEELQAYAIDHMGMSIATLRDNVKAKWWKSRTDAAKEVDDLSAFRLLTNFVREKRLRGD